MFLKVSNFKLISRLSTTNQLGQRTLAEMKLRLYLNLGLSSESQGNTTAGLEFISKVRNIKFVCGIQPDRKLKLMKPDFRPYTLGGIWNYRKICVVATLFKVRCTLDKEAQQKLCLPTMKP